VTEVAAETLAAQPQHICLLNRQPDEHAPYHCSAHHAVAHRPIHLAAGRPVGAALLGRAVQHAGLERLGAAGAGRGRGAFGGRRAGCWAAAAGLLSPQAGMVCMFQQEQGRRRRCRRCGWRRRRARWWQTAYSGCWQHADWVTYSAQPSAARKSSKADRRLNNQVLCRAAKLTWCPLTFLLAAGSWTRSGMEGGAGSSVRALLLDSVRMLRPSSPFLHF